MSHKSDWQTWTYADIPGFPAPVEGAGYAALRENIRVNGVQTPLLVDKDGMIWDGRSRHKACMELNAISPIAPPPYTVVTDGHKAAWSTLINRQMTVVERADLLAQIRSIQWENISHQPGERESEKFSAYLGTELGWKTGYSWKYLDGYQRIASAAPEIRALIMAKNPVNLNQALSMLRPARPPRPVRGSVDGPEHMAAIEQGAAFLNALEACSTITTTVEAILLQVAKVAKTRLKNP